MHQPSSPSSSRHSTARLFMVSALLLHSSLSALAQEYTLRLNMPKGDKYTFTNSRDVNTTMTIMGQDMAVKVKMAYGYAQEVRSVAADGAMTVDFTFTRVAVDMSGSGNNISYDTDKKRSAKGDSLLDLSRVCDPLLGRKYSAIITPMGKVASVKGLKELQDTLTPNLDPGNAQMLKGMLDEQQVTKSLESLYGFIPAAKVKVGDKWTQSSNLDFSMPISMDVTYTLKEVKSDIAKIEYSSNFDSKDDNYNAGGVKMKLALKGTMTGKCDLNIKNGLAPVSKSGFSLKGTMETMGTEIPVSAEGTEENKISPSK